MTEKELRYANINSLRIRPKPNILHFCQEEYIQHYNEARANVDISAPYWTTSPFDGVRIDNVEIKNVSPYGVQLNLMRKPGAVEFLPANCFDICESDVFIQSLETIL